MKELVVESVVLMTWSDWAKLERPLTTSSANFCSLGKQKKILMTYPREIDLRVYTHPMEQGIFRVCHRTASPPSSAMLLKQRLHHRLLFSVALYTTSNHIIIQFFVCSFSAARQHVVEWLDSRPLPSHPLINYTMSQKTKRIGILTATHAS